MMTNEQLEKLMFWVKVAVGILFCFLAIRLFDRVGEFLWQFKSAPVQGYAAFGSTDTNVAIWTALREVLQAMAAIGSAILIIGWSILRAWWTKRWQNDKKLPVPGPNPQPEPDGELARRLRNLLDKLKNR